MLLGLDIGTTAVKAVVLDPAGGLRGSASRAHDHASPAPAHSEADPADWLLGALATTGEACSAAGIPPSAIEAVGVAGCVPCLVVLDADDRPLRPALLYNDGRAGREIDELAAELGPEAVLARTGAGVTQQSTLSNIAIQ